jgi:DNA-binding winged helix-turn-helix (wHTH) protein/tetratricopeptide (TPR) repeat protein
MSSAGSFGRIRRFRFGAFELDTELGEIRRSAIRLPLHGQPLQVLEILLLSPKQLVSREQLHQALWPEGTFVDFDDALNNCIRRLRQALHDDAEAPRFIETIPRRGYRFLADVEPLGEDERSTAVDEKAVVAHSDHWRFRKLAKFLAPALLVMLVVATVSWYRLRSVNVLTDKDVVVLADFDNQTGEAVFDHTLKTALAIDLDQSPFLSVMPDLRMSEILKQMERAPGDRITQEIGREICLRTSSKALLTGSIASIGNHYALQLTTTDCQTGRNLAGVTTEAESREEVLKSLGQAATILRSRLGESLASVQKYDKPLEEATTSSLQALQAFSDGNRTFEQKGAADSIPFFERAVELDPKFGYAYTKLGTMQTHSGEFSLGLENLTRGFELRDHLSAKERYMAAHNYYAATGELAKARQQIQLAAQEYPRDFYVRIQLAQHYRFFGQYEQAVAEQREAVRLQPDNFLGYNNLAMSYINLDRMDQAQAVLQEALLRKLDSPWLHHNRYHIAFLRNDAAAMQHELNWAVGKRLDESYALLDESMTQAYYGRLTKARKLNGAAVALALRDGYKEDAAQIQTVDAMIDAELGNSARALQTARAALALSDDDETRWSTVAPIAAAGDFGAALRLLKTLTASRSPESLAQKNYSLQVTRARIELTHGRAQRALAILESVEPFDLKPAMEAVFVRGQTYLAAGDGGAAEIEFQKILDHRGVVLNDVTGALAQLYLGRARALEAHSLRGPAAEDARAKARVAYDGFLALWNNADPDIPILLQAKNERAKLR